MLNLIKVPRIFTVNQVPKDFHEDSIMSGYRHPRSSATDCILSLFQLTNETLNIWTHFLPTWYFLWKLLTVVLTRDVWHDAFQWPLLVYLVSCCVYPLASSCAHTFSTMSVQSRHICYFFDYGALSFFSLGSAITYSAYVMPDKWVAGLFHRYYVTIAVFNTLICTAMACYSRLGSPSRYDCDAAQRLEYKGWRSRVFCNKKKGTDKACALSECRNQKLGKMLRVVAFAYPYLFDNIPVFYRLFVCAGEECSHNETNSLHYQHVALAFLTAFLFITHLPERLAPGCFDYIGHSHQLFHVSAIMGTHVQMQAIQMDMSLRETWLRTHALPFTFRSSFGAGLLCVTLSLLVIYLFSQALCWAPSRLGKSSKKLTRHQSP